MTQLEKETRAPDTAKLSLPTLTGEYLGFFSAFGYWAGACVGDVTYGVHSEAGRLRKVPVCVNGTSRSSSCTPRSPSNPTGVREYLVPALPGTLSTV